MIQNKAAEKLRQLKEARRLVDDIGSRLDWAEDFCEFESIRETLSILSKQAYETYEDLEKQQDLLERALEDHEAEEAMILADHRSSSYLNNYLD